MKLKECGVIWIEDTAIYVADIDLYPSASEFLVAVLSHIYDIKDEYGGEAECGWFEVPIYDEYLPRVGTAYMRHTIASEPEWWMENEPGRGHRKVWCINFEN